MKRAAYMVVRPVQHLITRVQQTTSASLFHSKFNYCSYLLLLATMKKFLLFLLGASPCLITSFVGTRFSPQHLTQISSQMKLFSVDNLIPQSPFSRRQSLLSPSKAFGLLSILTLFTSGSSPALAGQLEDANYKLTSYGLPPILFVPPGFSPLVSEFGRGNLKEAITNPILVQFCRPQLWVVATTNVNNNGEAGTISANDYIKGDSAFFFSQPLEQSQSASTAGNKEAVTKFLLKSLSQKGDPVDSFKVLGVRSEKDTLSGRSYTLVDISYTLNTQAGFLVDRRGVASVTSVGPFLQGLVSVTTTKRWKTLEGTLRDIASSFRVYPLNSGIFSAAAAASNIAESKEQ